MRYLMIPLWVAMILVSRCVPHLANFSPVITLGLFAGVVFNRRLGIAVVVVALLASDVLLSHLYHYPVLGGWTLFVYSGLIATVLLGSQLRSTNRFSQYFLMTLGSGVGFWVWTNLASWWSLYTHNIVGLTECYVAALPFLQRSLIGTLVSLPILYFALRGSRMASQDKCAVISR